MERDVTSRSICILSVASAWGGAERHTVDLTRTLLTRGHDVRIVELGTPVLTGRPELRDVGVEVMTMDAAKDVKAVSTEQWRSLLDHLAPDIVVLAKGAVTVGSIRLDRAAAANGRAYVTIEHRDPYPVPPLIIHRSRARIPWPNWERVRRRIRYWKRSQLPGRIICVSDSVRRTLVEWYHFPPERTYVARNGTDVARFAPRAGAREAARATWGATARSIVIGAIARFDPVKGLGELITTFAAVRARHPTLDLRLVLVGDGPLEEQLHAQAADSGAADAIVFAGPTIAPWDVYPGFDVFALPSRIEGLPLALLEAMASGVPPVCYGVGGVPEVVSDPRVGWLIEPGRHASFERALEEAVTLTPEARAAYSRAARDRIVESFDSTSCMARLAALIETAPTTS